MTERKYTKKLDNPAVYVESSKRRVAKQSAEIKSSMVSNMEIWGPGECIKNYVQDCFNNPTGGIKLKDKDVSTEFFKKESRRNGPGENFTSRGANYFISINPLRNTVAEKLNVIRDDLQDAFSALQSENISWKEKAALLDYVKQHALTLYHALQYPKRFGISLSKRHIEAIRYAEELAIESTTAFYRHLLGYDFDKSVSGKLLSVVDGINSFGVETSHFKVVELDNPLIILGNAYANAIKYSDANLIIALPAGGTQPGIVTKMCMDILGRNPDLHFVPLSTHSTKKQTGEELSDTQLDELVNEIGVKGKNILVTEDNSNSGKTIVKITDAIKRFSPKKVNVSLAELDPWRVMVKSQFAELEVTDESHPDFDTAVNVVPITRNFLPDRQLRKVAAQRIVFDGLRVNSVDKPKPVPGSEYANISTSADYKDFKKAYEEVLRKVGDKFGYRNPFMVAQELIKMLAGQKYLEMRNTQTERDVLSAIATASVTYPYIPEKLKASLNSGASISQFKEGVFAPWMIEGARKLLDKSFETVARNGGALYIWTKGDFHRQGYESLPGAHEQGFRYHNSGLEDVIAELRERHGVPDSAFKFLSLPSKLRLIKEVVSVDAKRIGAEVFVIEDTVENIVEAKRLAVNSNVTFDSFLIDRGEKAESLRDCTDKVQSEMQDKRVLFVYDMDDTLLHEDFRKENQPINIYLAMKELGLQ